MLEEYQAKQRINEAITKWYDGTMPTRLMVLTISQAINLEVGESGRFESGCESGETSEGGSAAQDLADTGTDIHWRPI